MGRRETYRESECFRSIEDILKRLSGFVKRDTAPRGVYDYKRLYRILGDPIRELDLWEEYGGYDPEKSIWHRYVATGNRYLGCMMRMGLSPPWLRRPQVMIETHRLYPSCLKYSEAAVGNVPTVRGERLDDVYVSQEDLPLFECWEDRKVGIDEIKTIYIDEGADEDVKKYARGFAERHNIPIEEKIPCPSDDDKTMREFDRPGDRGVTDERLRILIKFLDKREELCHSFDRPIWDSVAAALAESMDEEIHRGHPMGASDAIAVKNQRMRERPPWGILPPDKECDAVVCEKNFEENLRKIYALK